MMMKNIHYFFDFYRYRFKADPLFDITEAPLTEAKINVQCPLGDIGGFLRPDLSAFRPHNGYIKCHLDHAEAFKERYRNLGVGGPVVGLSWRSPRKRFGALKSTDLSEDWGSILSVPGLTFISLQYGPVEDVLAKASERYGVKIYNDPDVDASNDIDALSAQISAMDLVISVSNTTVHLAGSQGIPVWNLIPLAAGRFWYWFDGLTHSPWYPSMRLYQQQLPGNWEGVTDLISKDLKDWANAG